MAARWPLHGDALPRLYQALLRCLIQEQVPAHAPHADSCADSFADSYSHQT